MHVGKEGHLTSEAESAVMRLQVQDQGGLLPTQKLPGPLSTALQVPGLPGPLSTALQVPPSWTSSLQDFRGYTSAASGHQICVDLSQQPEETS